MDNQQSTKMPKPFDSDQQPTASGIDGNQTHFNFQDDDRLKQEDEYRQGLFSNRFYRSTPNERMYTNVLLPAGHPTV
jgi:hypothetical protein